jgi:hypothetical protein
VDLESLCDCAFCLLAWVANCWSYVCSLEVLWLKVEERLTHEMIVSWLILILSVLISLLIAGARLLYSNTPASGTPFHGLQPPRLGLRRRKTHCHRHRASPRSGSLSLGRNPATHSPGKYVYSAHTIGDLRLL